MIVDTSLLLAAFVPDQRMHAECARALDEHRPLVLSPLVLAELDYLTARIAGVDPELALLAELSSGAYELASFGVDDLARAAAVVERYRDLPLGLTTLLWSCSPTGTAPTSSERSTSATSGSFSPSPAVPSESSPPTPVG